VATQRFAIATVIAMVGLALLAPALGAVADYRAIRKKLLAVFLGIGASTTALMFIIYSGNWFLALALIVIVELSAAIVAQPIPHLGQLGMNPLGNRFVTSCAA
jgi:UMF1 family MFS transporter